MEKCLFEHFSEEVGNGIPVCWMPIHLMRRIKVVSHGVGNGLRDELQPEPVAFLDDPLIGKPQCGDAAVNVEVVAVINKSRLGISGKSRLLR